MRAGEAQLPEGRAVGAQLGSIFELELCCPQYGALRTALTVTCHQRG
jgi:hypothetical protein